MPLNSSTSIIDDGDLRYTITTRTPRLLAIGCLKIMRAELRFNLCELPSSFLFDEEVSDLSAKVAEHISLTLRYCCTSWQYHLLSSNEPTLLDHVLAFVSNQLLFWMEAMNLLKRGRECLPMLQSIKKWANRLSTDARRTTKPLSDALHFVAQFFGNAVSQSTPHLYLSVLGLCHPTSEVYRRVSRHFRCLPSVRSPAGRDPALLVTNKAAGQVRSVAVSLDGRHIVSGGDALQIWDAESGESVGGPFDGYKGRLLSVAFSPDAHYVSSGGEDHIPRVWEVQSGAQVDDYFSRGNRTRVDSTDSSDDRSRWMSHIKRAEVLKALEGRDASIKSPVFSPDGSHIASAGLDGGNHIWETGSRKRIMTLPVVTSVLAVAFSSDGKWVLSGDADGFVRMWNAPPVSPDLPLKSLKHGDWVRSVAFFNDDNFIISAGDDKMIRIWSVVSGTQTKALAGHTASIRSIAVFPDGDRLVSGSDDGTVRIWDLLQSAGELEQHGEHTKPVTSVCFSPDGKQIASGSYDRSIRIWDSQSGEPTRVLSGHHDRVQSLAYSPDGKYIVSGGDDEMVRLWDSQSDNGLRTLPPPWNYHDWVRAVAFSPDGRRVAWGGDGCFIIVWDIQSRKQVASLEGHTDWVLSLSYSKDGNQIVSGSRDDSVRVWDVTSQKEMGLLKSHTSDVNSVAFSPDGACVVSGSSDCTIRIWPSHSRQSPACLQGHEAQVWSTAISPDGKFIVSGGGDRTVRVWDLALRQQKVRLEGHVGRVNSVAFSRDGTRIVSGGDDRVIRVWDKKAVLLSGNDPNAHSHTSACWSLEDDGWMKCRLDHKRLLWLPPSMRTSFITPENSPNLDNVPLGDGWGNIWDPASSISGES